MIVPCKKCNGDGFQYTSCGCREAMCPHTSLMGEPTDPDAGLYMKFWVRRTDGSSRPKGKHEACDYFVLDWEHDRYAVAAAEAYAVACEAEYPDLARDLRARACEARGAWLRKGPPTHTPCRR